MVDRQVTGIDPRTVLMQCLTVGRSIGSGQAIKRALQAAADQQDAEQNR